MIARRGLDRVRIRDKRHVRDRNHVGFGIARRVAEGEQLLEVGFSYAGGGEQLAPRCAFKRFSHPHQPAGEGPSSLERPASKLDEVGLETLAAGREQHGIDRDLWTCVRRTRVPIGARRGLTGSALVRCRRRHHLVGVILHRLGIAARLGELRYALSSSIRSSARRAPSRTPSSSAIS